MRQLRKRQSQQKPQVSQVVSQDNVREPTLGLPGDPEREVNEAVKEVKS